LNWQAERSHERFEIKLVEAAIQRDTDILNQHHPRLPRKQQRKPAPFRAAGAHRCGGHASWVGGEVEAEERGVDGTLVWKADVLARRRNVATGFEVELSNPDCSTMGERQERYKCSGVRGL
jgi:hypothetical protein